jgi:hypothetical protein
VAILTRVERSVLLVIHTSVLCSAVRDIHLYLQFIFLVRASTLVHPISWCCGIEFSVMEHAPLQDMFVKSVVMSQEFGLSMALKIPGVNFLN